MSGGGGGVGGGAFSGADITTLRAMIANGDPETLDSVAAKWAAVDLALQQAQQDFLHHTRAATAHWTGTAADAFTARASELHTALGAGASYASHASSGVSYAADALRAARGDMPPEPTSLQGALTTEQAQTTGTDADAFREQQRRRAVAVIETLEQRYAAAAEMFGTPVGYSADRDHGAFAPSAPAPSRANSFVSHSPAPGTQKYGQGSRSPKSPSGLRTQNSLQGAGSSKSISTQARNPAGTAECVNPGARGYMPSSNDGTTEGDRTASSNPASTLAEEKRIHSLSASSVGETSLNEAPRITAERAPLAVAGSHTVHFRVSIPTRVPESTTRKYAVTSGTNSGSHPGGQGAHGRRYQESPPEVVGGSVVSHGAVQHEVHQTGSPLPSNGSIDENPPLVDTLLGAPHPSGKNSQRARRNRASYLTEDSSTWLGPLDANPPVIQQ